MGNSSSKGKKGGDKGDKKGDRKSRSERKSRHPPQISAPMPGSLPNVQYPPRSYSPRYSSEQGRAPAPPGRSRASTTSSNGDPFYLEHALRPQDEIIDIYMQQPQSVANPSTGRSSSRGRPSSSRDRPVTQWPVYRPRSESVSGEGRGRARSPPRRQSEDMRRPEAEAPRPRRNRSASNRPPASYVPPTAPAPSRSRSSSGRQQSESSRRHGPSTARYPPSSSRAPAPPPSQPQQDYTIPATMYGQIPNSSRPPSRSGSTSSRSGRTRVTREDVRRRER